MQIPWKSQWKKIQWTTWYEFLFWLWGIVNVTFSKSIVYNKKEFPISKYKSGLLIYIFFNFGENLWSSFNQYTSLFTGSKSGSWWEYLTNLMYTFISFRLWLANRYKLLWLRIRPLLSEVSNSGPSSQDRSQVSSSIRVFQLHKVESDIVFYFLKLRWTKMVNLFLCPCSKNPVISTRP